jgi:hypothetical protein
MLGSSRKPQDGLAALYLEIAAEKAGALGRIAEKLQTRLDACARAREQLSELAAGPARAKLLGEYEQLRQDAKLHYWYLMVQRESIGLYDHKAIAQLYPMPPRLS